MNRIEKKAVMRIIFELTDINYLATTEDSYKDTVEYTKHKIAKLLRYIKKHLKIDLKDYMNSNYKFRLW